MKTVKKIAWLLSFVLIVSTVFGNVNLKAMAAEATTLTITIEDNTGVDGNYVEYSTNNGESWTKVQSDIGYTLAEANAELTDDSEFKIRAVRGDNIQVECSDVAGFTESDFGGIPGENGGIFKLKEKTAYSLKVSFMSNNQGEGGNQGNQDNFDLGRADSIENGIFTKTDGGTATLKVGGTMYDGNDSSIRVPALDTTIVVQLTANEGKKGVLRFGGGSSLAFREDMITTDGQTTTYTFTLSGIGVTDLNAAFVALNIDFEDTQPGGGGGGPEPGGSSDAISLVIEGDALNLVNNGVTVEYSTDGGSKWISITTNTTLDPIVDSAKVKVMFDSDNVMVQGDIAAGGSVTSGTVYDITQKQQYCIQIDKKVYTVVWAYGYPNSFGTDATVTNGKVEIISAVKSGETETWSGIEPMDIPGANNNNQTAEGGRVAIIPGSTVTVKIVPDYGYQFIEGMLNGQAIVAQDEISTFTFTMPNTNLHLSALFTETQDVIDCTATGVTGGSITGGENVIDSGNLQLSVTDAGISDAEKNKLKESTAASGVQVDQWLEVDLMQFVEKGDTGEQWTQDLEELKAKITITLNVGMLDTNKEYVVVREHNGAYEQIPATYNSAEGTLNFESDKFSNYAVGTKVTANDIVGTINTNWTGTGSDAASTVTILTSTYEKESIATAIQSNGTVNQNLLTKLSTLEDDYNTEKNVTLQETLVKAAASGSVSGTITVVGAGFNTPDGSSVQLVIAEKSGNGITVGSGYNKAIQLNISLYKTEGTTTTEITALTMPVTITMPVPAGLDASKLVILHDKNGDGNSDETIIPAVSGSFLTFTVTSFSNFAFAERASSVTPTPTSTPSSDNDSGSLSEPAEEKKVMINVEYMVVKGDTLSKIAKMNHLNLSELLAMNPQIKNLNRIYPGQKIVIGHTTKVLTDQEDASTPANAEYYVVRRGDCLYWIARRNGLSLPQLLALNPEASKKKYIYAGQRIRVR